VTVSRDSLFLWLWIPDLHSASLRLSGTTLESVARTPRTNIPVDSFTHHKEFFSETASRTLP
jgi:hypothetical protein